MNDKMTAEERAAIIVNAIAQEIPVLTSNRKRLLHKEICLEIKSAESAAYQKGFDDLAEHRMESNRQAFERGAEQMRERAAKIFESEDPTYPFYSPGIVQEIRALPLSPSDAGKE